MEMGSFRRAKGESVSSPSTKEVSDGMVVAEATNPDQTESTQSIQSTEPTKPMESAQRRSNQKISAREASNMKLSVYEQMKENLKQAASLYLNWVLGLIGFSAGVIFFGVYQLWMVPFLMVKYQYSRTLASIVVGVGLAGSAVAVITFGEISRRWKRRRILLFGSALLFCAFIALIYAPVLPLGVAIMLSFLTGAGFGCNPVLFVLGREYNWYYGAAETATGLINMIMMTSGFAGQYTIGVLLDYKWRGRNGEEELVDDGQSREYLASDYQFAFIVAPIAIVMMVLLIFTTKETKGKNLDYSDRGNAAKEPASTDRSASDLETDAEKETLMC